MEHTEDFWATRTCFSPPIPELTIAADLLHEAADAVLAGDLDYARVQLRSANIPAVHAFAAKIMGSWDPLIHRRRKIEHPAEVIKARVRMPSQAVQAVVFARDGWRCRYCGVRVVLPDARKFLVNAFPEIVCWPAKDKDKHAAFFALSAVADHVVPHALGGGSGEDNLVTTCQSCNYGKGNQLLEEVGLIDPRSRPPVVDEWDGLGRLLPAAETRVSKVGRLKVATGPGTRSTARAQSQAAWVAEIDRVDPGLSERLFAWLSEFAPLGISWALNKYLIVRLTVGGNTLEICGVAPNGDVTFPWLIGTHKKSFRFFAETVAAALPEGQVHESSTQWIVKQGEKDLFHVRELMTISPELRDGIVDLVARIVRSSQG